MLTDYTKIAEENVKKYGTDIGRYGSVLLAHLYSDRTHFIYEILQNAEDARAKEVSFHLFRDRLEVRHNGRLFDSADVQGICGLVEGTKKDDLTQIGKFGIGFKSVYAYTNTPKIYSGDEAFCIENYVLPHAIDRVDIQDNETLFVFPFNHGEVFPEQAFKEIAKRLRDIGNRTLLFLTHIGEIAWYIDGQESGNYIRDVKTGDDHKKVYVLSKVGEHNIEEEEWVVFEKPLNLNVTVSTNLKVEAAFNLGKDKNGREIVIPARDSKLIVFFPTEKPTYLNFLIQGPYKTTPNRENIPLEDEQNEIIVRQTGELVAESISLITKLGYINVNFLNILPIDSAHTEGEPIYATIFEQVKTKLLSDEELLPTHDGQYTKASDALLARSKDLTEILNQEDTELLFSRKNWLSTDITYDRTRELREYLIDKLKIKEIDFDDFARNITSEFLERKSDEWMTRFYSRLLDQRGLWSEKKQGILRTKPIIRLDDNSHAAPYDKDGNIQVYLPTESKSKYKTVKNIFVENEDSLKFFEELGLKPPDILAEIREFVLPKYYKAEAKIEENEYLEDFKKLLIAFDMDSDKPKRELLNQLSSVTFIQSVNLVSKEEKLLKPSEVYLNTEELRAYFDGYNSAFFIFDKLFLEFDKEILTSFLRAIGVEDKPRRIQTKPSLSDEDKRILRRNTEYTSDVHIKDYEYDGLLNIMKTINKDKSLLIWEMLLKSIESLNSWNAKYFFKGEYSYKGHFGRIHDADFDAKFLKTLRVRQWIFDKNGEFKRPSQVKFSDLPDDYKKNYPNVTVLKEILQFKSDVFDQLPEDDKNKLELVKGRSTREIEEALALLDKQRTLKEEKDKKEDSWIPRYAPDDIEEIVSETVVPVLYEPPNLEGQVEYLKPDGTSDESKSEEEKAETKEDIPKITPVQKKEIGNWGERYVLRYLKEQYKGLGTVEDTGYGFFFKGEKNNTIEVFWLNIKSEAGKGYDFVIREDGIEYEYIEVKTKLREEEELVEITGIQWEFARKLFNQNEGDKYWIYAVVNAGQSNVKIKKFQNPIKLWKDGRLYAHPIHFKL